MITDYKIAHGVYTETLEKVPHEKRLESKVCKLIQEGWQPHGSIIVARQGQETLFLQAMVKQSKHHDGVGEGVMHQLDQGVFG